MAPFFHQTRQHQIGVERRVAFDGAGFPVQPEFLFGEMFHQQTAQLLLVQMIELGKQVVGAGRIRCWLFKLFMVSPLLF